MRDTGGQLPERSELLRLDQAVLRGSQIIKRLRQFAGALLLGLKKPHIFDRDHGLVGEQLDQLDLLLSKWPNVLALQSYNADGRSFPQ